MSLSTNAAPDFRNHYPGRTITPEQVAFETAEFMRKVYAFMAVGLGLTALTAFLVSTSPAILGAIFHTPFVFTGLIIAELLMVVAFSRVARTMGAPATAGLFFLYAVTNGLTLSLIFIVYTHASIFTTFFVTGGMFAAMSIYGFVTKRDLSGFGNFLFMALIGLILGSFVNMFLHSPAFYWFTTYAGILLFVGLTAYDTQKIKELAQPGMGGTEASQKLAIQGALVLYLDFINLFLYLLRLFGRRR